MRAGLRLGLGLVAAALAFAPAPALAQDTADPGPARPANKAPATDAIGPRELQNFSIDGTVTRPADPQPAARQPPARDGGANPAANRCRSSADPAPATVQPAEQAAPPPQPQPREAARQAAEPIRQTAPAASVTVALPKLQDDMPRGGSATAAARWRRASPADPAAGTLAPERKISFLPWLLAAVALGAAARSSSIAAGMATKRSPAARRSTLSAAPPEPAPSPPAPKCRAGPPAASAVLDPGTCLDAPQAMDRFQFSAGALRR